MLYDRVNSIDITRGLIISFLIFINFLFINNIPLWPSLLAQNEIPGIAGGFILPAFIFLYCVTIPFSITKKINEGISVYDISKSIFARSLILITVGVLLVNTLRVEPDQTGFSRFLWSCILIIAIFLVWNRYPEKENSFFTTTGLRFAGLAILVLLVFRFRSGSYENNGSLIPGWWELPGLTGWGYLLAAFTYLLLRNSAIGITVTAILFLALNVLSYFGYVGFLESVRPYFGVLTNGYIPFIALSGLLSGVLIRKFSVTDSKWTFLATILLGVLYLASGLAAEKFLFTGGIYDNPAWALMASGAVIILFSVIFLLDDVLKLLNKMSYLKTIGKNMTMVYLIPFFLLNLAGLTKINILFFRVYDNTLLTVVVSVLWTGLTCSVMSILLKLNIRLKF